MRQISKKKWNYSEPSVRMTRLSLEALICQSLRFKTQVDPLVNINAEKDVEGNPVEPFYFES